ncbi:MAG: TspO/MBR family protein [Anaerolineae bacterium]
MGSSRLREVLRLVVSIVACQLAGGIGAIFTTPAIPTWYASLNKPSFNPPNTVFFPVWTTLYTLMGIAAFMVWRKGLHERRVRVALGIFVIQLVLNTAWTIIFFGLYSLFGAVIAIVFLWIAILINIVTFWRISKVAGALLIPYILWVSFAGILNISVWMLNR